MSLVKWEYQVGDLVNSVEKVIAHGCNCIGVMGAGIAKQLAMTYPDILLRYQAECRTGVFKPGSCQAFYADPGRIVLNLGTQLMPGGDARPEFIMTAMLAAARWCHVAGVDRLAIPQIGCGLGGLQWSAVRGSIAKAAKLAHAADLGFPTIVVYTLKPLIPVNELPQFRLTWTTSVRHTAVIGAESESAARQAWIDGITDDCDEETRETLKEHLEKVDPLD